jgi:hypothetical protein
MSATHNPRPFIRRNVAKRVTREMEQFTVKRHPSGGWTIAERQPGTSVCLYRGNFPSEGAANAELLRQTAAAIAAGMKGIPTAAPTEAPKQMQLI